MAQTLHFKMQKTRTDSPLAVLGRFGKAQAKSPRAPEPVEDSIPVLPKGAKAKARATSKSRKNPMQSLAQLRYTDISRAFKQAPWRIQVQVIASLASAAIVIAALGGLYLTEASRAATAGRDVQALQVQKADLQFAIDRQTALIAQAKAVSLLEQRATALGYVPADVETIDYVLVEGYHGPESAVPVEVATAPQPELPDYNETLGTWAAGVLTSVIGTGGFAP
jgi:hypothetical protein